MSGAIDALGAPVLALAALSGPEAAYGLTVVLLGYVVLGASGFGSALVIVPLLALRWPLTLVVPFVLLIDAPAAAWHARLNLPQVAWAQLIALLPGFSVGLAAAWALPGAGAGPWLLGVLGAYVLAVACRGLLFPGAGVVRPHSRSRALVVGTAAGWVEASFGTSGPLFAAWFTTSAPELRSVRATVPVAIAGASLLALGSMAAQGQLHQPLIWGALPVALAVGLLGVRLGHGLAAAMSDRLLSQGVFVLLLASALSLVAHSAHALRA